jgi:hypothetical protein
MADPMSARYRKTRYGWEPRGAWDKPLAAAAPSPQEAAEGLISRLVDETAACGCSPKNAVKYWDWILRRDVKAGRGAHAGTDPPGEA